MSKDLYTIQDIAEMTRAESSEVYNTIKLIAERAYSSELILLYEENQKDLIVKAVYQTTFQDFPSKMNELQLGDVAD